ncbi:MAG TPA: hypothetical protein VMD30_02775 [Tepidisphaeraceae bacterium]|nr:hypothetical protein [Tepidisphaeraceae bacterium]
MSGDEIFACILSVVIAFWRWGRWYWRMLSGRQAGPSRLLLSLVPPACALSLFICLRAWASRDVRNDPTYLAFYLAMGAAWVGLALLFLPMFAINVRDDVVERRNPAPAWTAAGAIAGATACFAGANIGEGPGWWVVVFCGFLSTGGLFVSWAVVQSITGAADTITIDRDAATGLRLAGVLLAVGIILGRAVAGDWVSAPATVNDFFRYAWPVLPLLACESVLGRVLRPSAQNPVPSPLVAGIIPALLYIGWAVAALMLVGPPS